MYLEMMLVIVLSGKVTSAFFNASEDQKARLRGTVKEHSDYKGTKQTILQRCKVDAVKL